MSMAFASSGTAPGATEAVPEAVGVASAAVEAVPAAATDPGSVAPVPLQAGLLGLAFPLLFSVVGLVLLYIGGGKLYRVWRATRNFEPVSARVVSSRLEEGPDRASRTYGPEVTYRYTYDDEEYTNSTVHPGGTWMTGNRARMKRIVDEYDEKVGEEVTAHVDPADPGSAYLRVGKLWHAYATTVFGLLLLVVAVGLSWVVLTR